jgi:hypothetical protein
VVYEAWRTLPTAVSMAEPFSAQRRAPDRVGHLLWNCHSVLHEGGAGSRSHRQVCNCGYAPRTSLANSVWATMHDNEVGSRSRDALTKTLSIWRSSVDNHKTIIDRAKSRKCSTPVIHVNVLIQPQLQYVGDSVYLIVSLRTTTRLG